jgi:endonuclease YncB( thermonuclease family)
MISQLPDHRRSIRWALVVPAGVVLGLIVHAQDALPPGPTHSFDQMPARSVARVNPECSVDVRIAADERTIVLAGVTVPQSDRSRARLRQFLECLLLGEEVYIEPEPPAPNPPSRIPDPPVCLFRAPDGLFVNLEVVRQGYAEVGDQPTCEHLELLRHYEQRARSARKGIWAPPPASQEAQTARAASAERVSKADEIIVYVTKTGKKYHREGCPHLRKSSRAITLKEALEKGYEPCSHCKPPTLEDP